MGMLGDYRSIMKQSKALRANQDVGASMADMNSQLAALNASMANTAQGRAVSDGVRCQATVTAVRRTGAVINMAPSCELQLLVMVPGRPPFPVTRTEIVPLLHVARALPGQQLGVRVMADDPDDLFIDWDAS
jgi:hypothetical protein